MSSGETEHMNYKELQCERKFLYNVLPTQRQNNQARV